jgi:phospholipid/cholesterol/gamma-HCH transport system substrate-binding protein
LPRPSTKVKVGIFVLVALALIVAGIAILGGGSLLRQTEQAETYVNESVQGLDVGSPVKFRGVQIGRVSTIGFVQTEYQVDRSSELSRLVLVRFEIFPRTFGTTTSGLEKEVQGMIQRGLRVRLAQQGLTGTEYLEADFLSPDLYPPLPITWDPDALYIPSAPSRLSQFTDAAEEVMRNLRRTDIAKLIDEATSLVEDLRGTSEALHQFFDQTALTQMRQDLGESFANLKRLSDTAASAGTATLESLRDTVARLGDVTRIIQEATAGDRLPSIVADSQAASANLRKATNDLPQTMATLRGAIQRLDSLLVNGQGDVASTLDNLHIATENLRQLSETAKRYPSQLLFGGPPAGGPDRSGSNR